MLVREAYDVLRKLIKEGKGDLELVGVHGASGVSYDVEVYADVREKRYTDDAGILCDWEDGRKYVAVYLD